MNMKITDTMDTEIDRSQADLDEEWKSFTESSSGAGDVFGRFDADNIRLTKEELERVAARQRAISGLCTEGSSPFGHLVDSYMAATPDVGRERAAETVGRLIAGCESLTGKYEAAMENDGGFDAAEEIDSCCADMPLEERQAFLSESLSAVETLNLNAVDTPEEEESFRDTVAGAVDSFIYADESVCDVLRHQLADALENSTLILSGTEGARELMPAVDESPVEPGEFPTEPDGISRLKAELALAFWIEYEAGNIRSLRQGAIPEAVGIGSAAAVEEALIVSEVAKGQLSTDEAASRVRTLGGVATGSMISHFRGLGVGRPGGAFSLAMLSVLRASLMVCLGSILIGLPLVVGIYSFVFEVVPALVHKAEAALGDVAAKLRERVTPRIIEVSVSFREWIRKRISGVVNNDVHDF